MRRFIGFQYIAVILLLSVGFMVFEPIIRPNPVWAAEEIVVTAKKIMIRSGPSTNYKVVSSAQRGATFAVLAKDKKWYKVNYGKGKTGWLASWLVAVRNSAGTVGNLNIADKYGIITGKVVNVRSGPGTTYAKVAQLPNDSKVAVLAESNNWVKIVLPKGAVGWVTKEYIELKSIPKPPSRFVLPEDRISAPPSGTVPGNQGNSSEVKNSKGKITGKVVNVRTGPNTTFAVITKVPFGTVVDVIAVDSGWANVRLANGQAGWATLEYIKLGDITPPVNPRIKDYGFFSLIKEKGQIFLKFKSNDNIKFESREETEPKRLLLNIQGLIVADNAVPLVELPSFGLSRVELNNYNKDTTTAEVSIFLEEGLNYTLNTDEDGKVLVLAVPFTKRPLVGTLIAVDPGHGGVDPGAIGPKGLKEKAVVLDMANTVAAGLRELGADVIMTRDDDSTTNLYGRPQLANEQSADLFISIHANASEKSSVNGTSTFYYAPANHEDFGDQREDRMRLAKLIQDELVKELKLRDIGILEERFAVLRVSNMPSVLVETAFISNPYEESLLGQEEFRTRAANAIVRAIVRYYEGY